VVRVTVPAGPDDQATADPRADLLAVEEPLEIRVGGQPLAVTMRTPGHDIDLAAGFLATEGVIDAAGGLSQIKMCDDNVADVTLAPGTVLPMERLHRNFITSSACGVCGKDSIDAIRIRARYDVSADQSRLDPAVLAALPDRLRAAQRVFASTGGLMAGLPVLAAVSAPSSLAAELAGESGMTLVGFLRGSSMNVYSGAERLTAVSALS
jgi:formate dehydrogenase assembly factor FdhD